jgi:hypothetical protein
MIAYLECPKKKDKEISVVEGCMKENCKYLSAEISKTEEYLLAGKKPKRLRLGFSPIYYRCYFGKPKERGDK